MAINENEDFDCECVRNQAATCSSQLKLASCGSGNVSGLRDRLEKSLTVSSVWHLPAKSRQRVLALHALRMMVN